MKNVVITNLGDQLQKAALKGLKVKIDFNLKISVHETENNSCWSIS
jgi:hypothetical protein